MDYKGILKKQKFDEYYGNIDLQSYRNIFAEAIRLYQGKKFKKVLDIGCGVGSFLEVLKPFNVNSLGLEASDYALKICRKRHYSCKKILLRENNPLPFSNNTFSFILMNQIIEHLPKDTGKFYISEILRILEKGGVAFIYSPSYYSKIWRTDPNHVYCWKPFELLREVKKNKIKHRAYLKKGYLEPWMLFKYNKKIIDKWHKYNKYPKTSFISKLFVGGLDLFINKFYKSDHLLATSNVVIVKSIK